MFYKESRGLWVERVTDAQGKSHEFSAKSKADLKKKILAYTERVSTGPTFGEMADQWERQHYKNLEGKTAASYSLHVDRAKNYFHDMYIKDITPDMIQSFIDNQADEGYAKDTVRRTKTVVNRIFKFAMLQPGSLIKFNPCSATEVPKGLSKTRREPPTDEQLAKIRPDSEMGLFAYIIYYTGLRDGELLGLRWDDIDRDQRVIHVRRVSTYLSNQPVVKERTKTAAGIRDIPLLDNLLAVLPEGRTGYVFGGDKPLTLSSFRKRWTAWCKSIGEVNVQEITHTGPNGHKYTSHKYTPKITPYQFRHEYASLLEAAGVSEFDAKTAMGHSSIMVTKDIYTHIRDRKHQSELAKKMNGYVSGLAAKNSENSGQKGD